MHRTTYIAGRLVQIVPTLLSIAVIVFLLVHFLPGGPISALLGDKASDEAVARITRQYGLDQPMWIQFGKFVGELARGNLGESLAFRVPVARLIGERLPVTLMLTGMAGLLALLVAVPLAFVAARNQNRWPDLIIRGLFQIGLSSPIFYVGLILLTVFAAQLRIFPVGGYGETTLDRLYHLFLPALALALSLSAIIMRNLRAAVLSVLDADYVDFARAKGLPERIVFGRHVFRNALISTVTIIGLHLGELLGGAVITETVFAVPGVGRLMIDSIFARDYPVIQGLTLVLAVLVSLAFLITDLVHMALDPKNRQMTDAGIGPRRRKLPTPLIIGLCCLAIVFACALFPEALAPYDPLAFDFAALLQSPTLAHPFGTDNFGRDVLSRTISAAHIDLQIAFFSTLVPLIMGSLIGLWIGFRGGGVDIVFGRLVDLVLTFPFLVIVIAIVAVLGPGLVNMYIAVSIVGWVFYARLMRAEVLVQKQGDYVAATRVLGYRPTRILFRHIFPNCMRPILVYWVTDMALKILLGSSLGYLGLGAQPPQAEWGVLIADGKNFFTQAWWMTFFPGVAIVLAGLGFSLSGDGLADILEVKS